MKRSRTKKKRTRNRKSPKARQQRKRQHDQGPRGARPELHSRSQLMSLHQEINPQSHLQMGKTSVAKSMGAKVQKVLKKK